MKKIILKHLALSLVVLLSSNSYGQTAAQPVCNGNQFYAIGNPFAFSTSMKIFCQPVPLPATTTLQMQITGNFQTPIGCLAVGPSFNFNAPNPTFWAVSGSTYWYYNNSGVWVNTGHSMGGPLALNAGGGGSRIYNIAGAAGQVYVYNGTGTGTLLTTISGFNGTGMYDITADDADNFFILKIDGPQFLRVYDPTGTLQCSYNLLGIPTGTLGFNGGFAIVKNTVIAEVPGGCYSGNIIPGNSNITFTFAATSGSVSGAADFANCSLPIPKGNISSPNGTITCTNSLVQLNATIDGNGAIGVVAGPPSSTLNVCTYTWSGPGIVSGQSTASITLNQPGVYSFTTCAGFCPVYSVTASYTVTSQITPLTPTITAPACISNTANVSVSPSASTIVWSGPGIISGQGTPTITINSTGIYSVTLTNGNCIGSTSVAIQNPTIAINPHLPSVCSGNSVTLYAIGNATSYNWAPPIGLSSTMGATVLAGPNSTQTYTLTGNFNGCSVTAVETLIVNQTPNIIISAQPLVICAGSTSTLTAVGAQNYNWSPPSSLNTNMGPMVIASPKLNTVYSVTGSNGLCASTASILVSVLSVPTISITSSNSKICTGSSASLTAHGAQNYSWMPSTGLSGTSGPAVTASPASSTQYTIIGSNQSGTLTCFNQTNYLVEILPKVTALVSNSVAFCKGGKATLNASGGNYIVWSPSTGLNTTIGTEVTARPETSTVYTVNASIDGACNSYTTVSVQVNPIPTLNAGRDTVLNMDEPMFITALSDATAKWVFGDGIICTDCPKTQITPTRSGCYIALAENQFGCTITDEVCIEVINDFGIYIPNTFTPNDDGVNDEFFVSGYDITNLHLEIFDRWGQKLFVSTETQKKWDGKFKGVTCQDGVYVCKISYSSPGGKLYTKITNVNLLE